MIIWLTDVCGMTPCVNLAQAPELNTNGVQYLERLAWQYSNSRVQCICSSNKKAALRQLLICGKSGTTPQLWSPEPWIIWHAASTVMVQCSIHQPWVSNPTLATVSAMRSFWNWVRCLDQSTYGSRPVSIYGPWAVVPRPWPIAPFSENEALMGLSQADPLHQWFPRRFQ